MRPLPLPENMAGKLWLHSMPGRLESWSAFCDDARRRQLDLIVCLNPLDEVSSVSPPYRTAIDTGTLPCRWLLVPMRNFGVAADLCVFSEHIAQIIGELQQGRSVMLHCAAGIGRTGTVAACVLKQLGMSRSDALQRVRDAGSNPESAAQSGLLNHFGVP